MFLIIIKIESNDSMASLKKLRKSFRSHLSSGGFACTFKSDRVIYMHRDSSRKEEHCYGEDNLTVVNSYSIQFKHIIM